MIMLIVINLFNLLQKNYHISITYYRVYGEKVKEIKSLEILVFPVIQHI